MAAVSARRRPAGPPAAAWNTAFLNNWSAKVEYLYADLGKATCNAACTDADPFDVTSTTQIVRGGLNYKF